MRREVAAAYGHDDAVLLAVTAERQHPSLRADRGHLGAGVRHGRAPHRRAGPVHRDTEGRSNSGAERRNRHDGSGGIRLLVWHDA